MKIDLVYLWVDGNDTVWAEKRRRFTDDPNKYADTCKGRFANNDELKFSLRSVEQYSPWINKIHIVTDGQTPDWLNISHPKIHMVDHTEILPPEELPTFNSVVIEHALHRIPGLSEHFIYANDDMFFNRPTAPSDFFTREGLPVVRMNRRPLRKFTLWFQRTLQGKELSNYNRTILNAALLIKEKFGKYIGSKTHHNIDAYLKSVYEETYNTFENQIRPTLSHKMRHDDDIQRNIYSYYLIVKNKCRLDYVGRSTSFRLHIDNHSHYGKLLKSNPLLFCVNDSQYATDEDRAYLGDFLKKRFPDKCSFEK